MTIRRECTWYSILFLFLMLTGAIWQFSSRAVVQPTRKMRGMTEAGYRTNVFQSASVLGQLSRLKADGIDALSIQVGWYQNTDTSVHIFSDPVKTPSDASLATLIHRAHADGFAVFLDPFINANHGNAWQAAFHPRSVPQWFHSYDQYLAHYAQLAQKDHVQLLAIGDEFDSLDDVMAYQSDWVHALQVARHYYHGPLTYGADYTCYQKVTFWPELNQVGIDAYFPLSHANHPSVISLQTAWNHIADHIEAWRESAHLTRHPFVITELGYYSGVGAAAQPGAWTPQLPVDLSIQRQLYEAALTTIYQRPWLHGLFWFWWANASNPHWRGGLQDNGYTPRGKPAEQVIRQYFL